MQRFTVHTFTNQNGQCCSQAFWGVMPITREFPAGDAAPILAARQAFEQYHGHATLGAWNSDDGFTVEVEK